MDRTVAAWDEAFLNPMARTLFPADALA